MSRRTLRRIVALVAFLAVTPLLTACSSPSGPDLTDKERDQVIRFIVGAW